MLLDFQSILKWPLLYVGIGGVQTSAQIMLLLYKLLIFSRKFGRIKSVVQAWSS